MISRGEDSSGNWVIKNTWFQSGGKEGAVEMGGVFQREEMILSMLARP